ncbi:MAG: hypothetical protein ABIP55_14085, partial [Tepidisphaeraceae bacterium]
MSPSLLCAPVLRITLRIGPANAGKRRAPLLAGESNEQAARAKLFSQRRGVCYAIKSWITFGSSAGPM